MIAISMGDANGVGPEILLRSFQENKIHGNCMVIGDHSALRKCNAILGLRVPLNIVNDFTGYRSDALNINDIQLLTEADINPGCIAQKTGRAALSYIKKCTSLAIKGAAKAIVTLPVSKEAIRLTDPGFSGHTGFIAAMSKTENYSMMLIAKNLIVTHVSTHLSLSNALAHVKKKRIYDVILLTHEMLKKLRPEWRIAVAGVNPHAGENGAFGKEEIDEIEPAVRMAQKKGLDVSGPIAPDIVFYRAVKGHYDAVVCMYHDQGHIPVKLLDFEGGVNVTLGLPFIRTSVDHGTAYDIAYKGISSLSSFCNAYDLALELITK